MRQYIGPCVQVFRPILRCYAASHLKPSWICPKSGKSLGFRRLVIRGILLDLSCRKKAGSYYIVTDRWQKFTHVQVTKEILTELASWCDEFLVHAVDVEGKASGIEEELAVLLGEWQIHALKHYHSLCDQQS